jgi:hypothetical protein
MASSDRATCSAEHKRSAARTAERRLSHLTVQYVPRAAKAIVRIGPTSQNGRPNNCSSTFSMNSSSGNTGRVLTPSTISEKGWMMASSSRMASITGTRCGR